MENVYTHYFSDGTIVHSDLPIDEYIKRKRNDTFTGIIRLSITEKDFISYFLNNYMKEGKK